MVENWYAKRIGLAYLLWKTGIKYVKVFVWERSLEAEIPETKLKIPAEIKVASSYDMEKLLHMKNEWLKRLNDGDFCLIAVWKDRIIGYVWVSFKRRVYIPEFETEVNFESNEAYLYDSFVFSNFRRKGVLKKLLEEALYFLKSRNVEKSYAGTLTNNTPPQKALRALGFSPVKVVKFVKIFGFKRFEERKLKSE